MLFDVAVDEGGNVLSGILGLVGGLRNCELAHQLVEDLNRFGVLTLDVSRV